MSDIIYSLCIILLLGFLYCMLYGMKEHYGRWGTFFGAGGMALTVGAGTWHDSLSKIPWVVTLVVIEIIVLYGACAWYFYIDRKLSREEDAQKKRKEEEDRFGGPEPILVGLSKEEDLGTNN